ncbi:MAG: VanW family protein [Candidatus Komeilibacteria bacterium]
MIKIKINKNPKAMKWLLIIITASLILITLLLAFGFSLHKYYANKYIYGMSVAHFDIGGLQKDVVNKMVQEKVDNYRQAGINYDFNGHALRIDTTISSAELETSYDLIHYQLEETLAVLWQIGHEKGYLNNFWQQLKHLLRQTNYPLLVDFDENRFISVLQTNLEQYETIGRNAQPKIINDDEINILPHALGMTFDYQKIARLSENQARQLDSTMIEPQLRLDFPTVLDTDINTTEISNLKNFLSQEKNLLLKYEQQDFEIAPAEYQAWIVFINDRGTIRLAFDSTMMNQYFETNIAPLIDIETRDAKFDITNGRVTEFQSSRDGQKLNSIASIANINFDFFNGETTTYNLVVNETKAKIAVGDINDLGINEIIGIGRSNFVGSPANRVHNIRTGAAAINGLIIKPGETFSLITALGEIDANHNYLPELVIKGNETIPEYGGGLCQIGTTTFRAAIDSGLPIIERRNHSYRVAYYEPAGFDATIYNPKPDLRFNNDTKSNIIIQTRIEGTELIFEYWGTKDGRDVYYTEPTIYNITSPGPTKWIETTELEPGKEKCTERAHNGADAEFDYAVTYPDGTKEETTFTSHYVAWPEVCLRGIEEPIINESDLIQNEIPITE